MIDHASIRVKVLVKNFKGIHSFAHRISFHLYAESVVKPIAIFVNVLITRTFDEIC